MNHPKEKDGFVAFRMQKQNLEPMPRALVVLDRSRCWRIKIPSASAYPSINEQVLLDSR
jgi:hypothetical protein